MRPTLLLLLALLALPAAGLRLSGQLYELGPGPGFEPTTEALVVEAHSDGDLAARTVASRGSYALELGPGQYRMVARSPSGEVRATENVSLRADTRLDLILLPSLDIPDLPLNESLLGNLSLPEGRGRGDFPWAGVAAGAGAAVALLLWLRRRRTGAPPPPVAGGLPEDLRAMIAILKQEGGRMTQKELRRKLGYSEAKVSLMVADLENRGRVQKFKVGRGNIVVLDSGSEGASRSPGPGQSDEKRNEGS